MPASAGRDVARLLTIAQRSGLLIVATTGLHHDRYYGGRHWTNRVGVDEFDYTGPTVRRLPSKAGIVKAAGSAAAGSAAASGVPLDARDRRNFTAVAHASIATGAPVLTHCEGGWGGLEQVQVLRDAGVPATSIILSHVDKTEDLRYLTDLAESGVFLELDQTLRQHERGVDSASVRMVAALVEAGHGAQLVVGTDGARRSLWTALGGTPGLAWLATSFAPLLLTVGLTPDHVVAVMRENALAALRWRAPGSGG